MLLDVCGDEIGCLSCRDWSKTIIRRDWHIPGWRQGYLIHRLRRPWRIFLSRHLAKGWARETLPAPGMFLGSIKRACSFVPTCIAHAIARRCCQGWRVSATAQRRDSVLDSIEHGGRLAEVEAAPLVPARGYPQEVGKCSVTHRLQNDAILLCWRECGCDYVARPHSGGLRCANPHYACSLSFDPELKLLFWLCAISSVYSSFGS